MNCTIIPPGLETSEQYHASGSWGSTLISKFLSSPKLANLIRTGIWRPEPTVAMKFGSAFHVLMDPGGGFDGHYRVGPDVHHNTKIWKDAVATAAAEKVELLGADDHVDLQAMRASVFANPVAAHLLHSAEHEVGFRMPSGYGPFQVQCRADILHRRGRLADLKTCGDVDDFAGSVLTWGYHRQAALYRHIVHAACGEWLPFSFLVVESKAPLYRCRVVDLTDDYLATGWEEVEAALIEIGRRTVANDWRDHRDAESVDIPSWKRRAAQIAVAA